MLPVTPPGWSAFIRYSCIFCLFLCRLLDSEKLRPGADESSVHGIEHAAKPRGNSLKFDGYFRRKTFDDSTVDPIFLACKKYIDYAYLRTAVESSRHAATNVLEMFALPMQLPVVSWGICFSKAKRSFHKSTMAKAHERTFRIDILQTWTARER